MLGLLVILLLVIAGCWTESSDWLSINEDCRSKECSLPHSSEYAVIQLQVPSDNNTKLVYMYPAVHDSYHQYSYLYWNSQGVYLSYCGAVKNYSDPLYRYKEDGKMRTWYITKTESYIAIEADSRPVFKYLFDSELCRTAWRSGISSLALTGFRNTSFRSSVLRCEEPPILQGGIVQPGPYPVLKEVNIECNTGFSTINTDPILCQIDGSWTHVPKCREIGDDQNVAVILSVMIPSCLVGQIVIFLACRKRKTLLCIGRSGGITDCTSEPQPSFSIQELNNCASGSGEPV